MEKSERVSGQFVRQVVGNFYRTPQRVDLGRCTVVYSKRIAVGVRTREDYVAVAAEWLRLNSLESEAVMSKVWPSLVLPTRCTAL